MESNGFPLDHDTLLSYQKRKYAFCDRSENVTRKKNLKEFDSSYDCGGSFWNNYVGIVFKVVIEIILQKGGSILPLF